MNKKVLRLAMVMVCFSILFIISTAGAEIRVYGANDQYLGISSDSTISGIGSNSRIFVPSLNAFVEINRHGTVSPQIYEFYYETADCSGTPYAANFNIPTIAGGSSFDPKYGNKIFLVDTNSWEIFSPNSKYFDLVIPPTGWICDPAPSAVQPYSPLVEIELPFTLPVALPLRFEYVNCCEQPVPPEPQAQVTLPAITPGGIVILSSLIFGIGFWGIRRRQKRLHQINQDASSGRG